MLPSTLYIMCPMYLQSLKLLRPKFEEEIHLQINMVFDLDLSLGHMCWYPLLSTSCDLCNYKV